MARILLAGASGVVGAALAPLLLVAGHDVTGTTRTPAKAAALERAGMRPAVVDAFDAAALRRLTEEVRPEIVIHQLTDLPDRLEGPRMPEALVRNARLRTEGTPNLVAAALAAGARRMVAQSIAFAYAPGPLPYAEDAPLAESATGVIALERAVLAAPLEGLVLRYGRFYGPGTGADAPPPGGPLHVAEAARACLLAIGRGAPGVYNIAEEDGTLDCRKAARELGWRPGG
jgi:nucleoside-diphosphate-sugar epimerase